MLSASTKIIKSVEERLDQQGPCSRRNCLLIHGAKENSTGDTDKRVLNVINNDLEIDLAEVVIGRTHSIDGSKKKWKKVRPIIVRFVRYYDRK